MRNQFTKYLTHSNELVRKLSSELIHHQSSVLDNLQLDLKKMGLMLFFEINRKNYPTSCVFCKSNRYYFLDGVNSRNITIQDLLFTFSGEAVWLNVSEVVEKIVQFYMNPRKNTSL